MPGFVYYVPQSKRAALKLEQVRELGLGYAFEDRATSAVVTRGPDDGQGLIVGDPARVAENQLGYFRDRQRWLKVPPGLPGHEAGAWVGCSIETPLEPAHLAREQQLQGHWVRLADGKRWLAPVARKSLPTDDEPFRYTVGLPHVAGVDEAGQWTATNVVARYAPLWQTAIQFWDALLHADIKEETGEKVLTFSGALSSAVLALSANYRIGTVEATMLGILTLQHAVEVLEALVDYPTVREWLKKKQPADAGPSIESGPVVATPDTCPPVPIVGPCP